MLGRVLRIAVPVMLAVAAGLAASAGTGQAAPAPGWRIVATLPGEANFDALTATGPANAWTVGAGCSGNCTGTTLLIRHWNGKTWAEVTVPYDGSGGELALDGHGGIWLGVADERYPVHGYFLHYAGAKWSRVTAPAGRGETDIPDVLAWIPGTRSLWALGSESPASGSGPSPAVVLKDGV